MKNSKLRIILLVLEALYFVLAGFALVNVLPSLVEEVASTTPRLLYLLPFTLAGFSFAYLFYIVRGFLHPSSKKTYFLNSFVNGIVLACIGTVILSLCIVNFANGDYRSIVMGGVTLLFPLDVMLMAICLIVIGVCLILYGVKKAKEADIDVTGKGKLYRGLTTYSFGILHLLSAMYFGYEFLTMPNLIDKSGNNVLASLPFFLMMVVPLAFLIVLEVFGELKNVPSKKTRLIVLSSFLGAGVLLSILGIVAISVHPTLMSESLVAFFTLDFMASKAIGQIILYLINIVPPLVLLLRLIIKKED